ncbi:MAG: hypothetical protein V4565_10725 [Bacteroidota bacterium]
MENRNLIEKVTLVPSVIIICSANLFVLKDKIEKTFKNLVIAMSQKAFILKNAFLSMILIVLMSSCSSRKFLSRKYTRGLFIEHTTSLKHNTFFFDSTKCFASTNFVLPQISPKSQNKTKNEQIEDKVNSIIKRDSIFVFNRRGKNKTVIIKNNLPTVITQIDRTGKRVKSKILTPIQSEKVKRNYETKIKIFSIAALCFSLIPFLGLILSCTAKTLIKQNIKVNPFKNRNKYGMISNIAFCFSIISSLIGILIVAFLVFALFAFLLA